jgi:hypothetical protein
MGSRFKCVAGDRLYGCCCHCARRRSFTAHFPLLFNGSISDPEVFLFALVVGFDTVLLAWVSRPPIFDDFVVGEFVGVASEELLPLLPLLESFDGA